jgi:fused signal recognition particle receptor
MAFGFIKKVFSFGRKEVVEEKIDETAPLPPLNFDALKPPAEEVQQAPESESTPAQLAEQLAPELPQAEVVEPAIVQAPPEESATAEIAPSPARAQPAVEAEPEATPEAHVTPETEARPSPVEEPVEPKPKPGKKPEPVTSEPLPVEALPVEEAVVEKQEEAEPEPLAPVADAAAMPAEASPEKPEPVQPEAAPVAEIIPPIRQPTIEADPVLSDIAPEPTPVPSPASTGPKPAAGKVTVAKKVEEKTEAQLVTPTAAPRRSWFQRMKDGLARSSRELSGNIAGVFTKRKLDEDTLQDLEDVLIRADLGVETALRVTDSLAASRYGKDVSDAEVRSVMAAEVEKVLAPVAKPLELDLSHKPHVVLVVGVNGTGKTTTIGKLAAKLTEGGLSVMLAAGDTFRAAAIEQLKIWGERTKSPVIATKLGADAAGLAYDAFEKAKAAGSDVLIIDTAGRLQNKAELMAELEKIVRVLGKLDPEAPHTVLQTVDATTGQNALNQVEIFRNVAGVNGLVMTKLDGTARGGILVAIAAKHKLPVYFIGVGEQVDDLEPFSASDFAKAIAGVG